MTPLDSRLQVLLFYFVCQNQYGIYAESPRCEKPGAFCA